jgi:hypothetical protein
VIEALVPGVVASSLEFLDLTAKATPVLSLTVLADLVTIDNVLHVYGDSVLKFEMVSKLCGAVEMLSTCPIWFGQTTTERLLLEVLRILMTLPI